jgi:hypothetical protein
MKSATIAEKKVPPQPPLPDPNIERDAQIRFHELGTLNSVTRWISSHDEGLAEWLKNVRRAYQTDRANVGEKQRTALLLFQDGTAKNPTRIALLDVGGASLQDVTAWSTWQDPSASSRGSKLAEEETQGNGGKAYMYRLFAGPARMLGVKDGKLNCKGFAGNANSLSRGTPGFIPNQAAGRDLPNVHWKQQLDRALQPYELTFDSLPKELQNALRHRKCLTLVEGVEPLGYCAAIDAPDLLLRVLRHDQSMLAIQQLRLYAAHNGRFLHGGKPLELERIPPYPGLEDPQVHQIPTELPDAIGTLQSTTLRSKRPTGRLILYTSCENMPNAYRKLRPRWKVSYRTPQQMIGSKPISEVVPNAPGSQHIYATIELSALEPDYVDLGRRRPLDGPLLQALDLFIAEKIRALAKRIHESHRREFSQQALDELYQENQILDNFKNRFLPHEGSNGLGSAGPNGNGHGTFAAMNGSTEKSASESTIETEPEATRIALAWDPQEALRIGRGVTLAAAALFRPRIQNSASESVRRVEIEWCSADQHIARLNKSGELTGVAKGATSIWARLRGNQIESCKIPVEVWNVDHVLLTPRVLEIPLGRKKQILAEVTSDEGSRATNVFLNWKHDAPDPLIVRIQPNGSVIGNRPGKTNITAGAGDPSSGGAVWTRITTEVSVTPVPDELPRATGFPELRLTDHDLDPATGETRHGDAEQPALWQEVSDYQNNIWWLNLQSPDAAYFFGQREEDIRLWRAFHAQKVIDMVIQVHMREEFDAHGELERPDLWARHKVVLDLKEVHLKQAMWNQLKSYVEIGGLDE